MLRQSKYLKYTNDKDDRYGSANIGVDISFNIFKLWTDTKGKVYKLKEKNFISNFCKIVNHEYLHFAITYMMNDLWLEREEIIVDMMAESSDSDLKLIGGSMSLEFPDESEHE